MKQGIAIIGLNGSGKSTLNHMLARALGYFEMDVEDYYFPEQKEHRLYALEHGQPGEQPGLQPYSGEVSQAEVEATLLRDMEAHPAFVFSCVRMNWCEELLSRIGVAFLLQVPLETRLARIRSREEKRFGARALPGGDMSERQEAFRELVKKRDPAMVEESAKRMSCPVITLDGTLPLEENIAEMLGYLQNQK